VKVAVVGLGKIGLPLAVHYAGAGHEVWGIDVRDDTVDLVNSATEPFPGEQDLDARLKDVVGAGRLRATTSYPAAIPGADVVVVVVPLLVDDRGDPDFALLDSATSSIAATLTPGTVVIYETTLPVGVTRDRWRPALETSGLAEGEDFHLAFSPERVLTGRVFADLGRYPKIVGAFSDEGSRRATEFYESVLRFDDRPDLERPNGVWDLGSPEAAELTKLAETTYRDVNIALANQFALFSQRAGIDVHAVIAAANSQPYSHIHRPGISVGGHCIPVYPRLYLWGDPGAELVREGRALNASMPARVVDVLAAAYGDLGGATVAVLGAAYRGGVKETAFSGVFAVVERLREVGARAVVHDPLYSEGELEALGLVPHEIGSSIDAAVLHTDHASYLTLVEGDLPGARVILDGRNVLRADRFPNVDLLQVGVGVERRTG